MKIQSMAASALAAACFLVNNFALNAVAHPSHRSSAATQVTSTKTIYFDGYCVSVVLNLVYELGMYGESNGCNAPDVVAGNFSTIDGIPKTMVISGYFGGLWGADSAGLLTPIIVAIFPNRTFKAYSGSISQVNVIATGTWSDTQRFRSRSRLRFFGDR